LVPFYKIRPCKMPYRQFLSIEPAIFRVPDSGAAYSHMRVLSLENRKTLHFL